MMSFLSRSCRPLMAALVATMFVAVPHATATATAKSSIPAGNARCLLSIDGRTIFQGRCKFERFSKDGSFTITERHRYPYFGYLLIDGRTAQGYWNGERGANHAHNDLGMMTRKGGCWQNRRARICAWR